MIILKYTSDVVSKRRAKLPITQMGAVQSSMTRAVGAGSQSRHPRDTRLLPNGWSPPAGKASADGSWGSRGTQSQHPSARLADVTTNHLAIHQEDQIQISVQKNKRQVFKKSSKPKTLVLISLRKCLCDLDKVHLSHCILI